MELWLVVSTPGGPEREVEVDIDADDHVADLRIAVASAVGAAGTPEVFLHRTGGALDESSTIGSTGLRFGDHITLAPQGWKPPARSSTRTGPTRLSIAVVGGPCAGQRHPLGAGDHVVGRSSKADIALDDPTLSRLHVRLSVRDSAVVLGDAGSANGTFIDGNPVLSETPIPIGTVVEAGHSLLRLDPPFPPASEATAGPDGLVRFNRPPRTARPPASPTFAISAPPTTAQRRRIPMITSLGPLVMGIPMVGISAASGNTVMMAMGLVTIVCSPLLAVASTMEDRRGGRAEFRRQRESFRAEVETTAAAIAEAVDVEMSDRRQRSPDAVDVLDRALHTRYNLWERRPDDDDFLVTSIGWADQPTRVQYNIAVGGDLEERAWADERLASNATVRSVPVLLALRTAGTVGYCGDLDAVRSSVRWVLVQAAALHSPRDLVIAAALAQQDRSEWAWLRWLPHTRTNPSPLETPHLAFDETDGRALIEAITSLVKARREEPRSSFAAQATPTPAVLLLLTAQTPVQRAALSAVLERGPEVGVYCLWLDTARVNLPGECGVIVTATDRPPSITVATPSAGADIHGVVVDQLTLSAATAAARALSPVRDVTAGGSRGQIPSRVSLLELLGIGKPTSAAIRQRWQAAPIGIDAPIGRSAIGEFVLDIRSEGPHALVGGTTGAGKSELLQSVVAALAASHPPTGVTFLLVDYKGGAAFKDCVRLPHTVGMVTDLDGHLVKRALTSLHAELRRREHLLRDFDAKDLLEMERRHPQSAPPALLLIVDEFATLAKELPEFVEGVVSIAQRGRSLGIHLILATQRPAGAINDNIRANTNLRIALRMNDEADSVDVINSKDAAHLPRSVPGRALLRTGQSELTEVQVAYVGGVSGDPSNDRREAPRVAFLDSGATGPARASGEDDSEPTDLQQLVTAIQSACADLQLTPPRPPWLPPLPLHVSLLNLPAAASSAATLGMCDMPDIQEQQATAWNLDADAALLIYGTSGAGKSTLLRTIAVSVARSNGPDQAHIYALDFGTRALQSLLSLDHCGAVISSDEPDRVKRLLIQLEREIESRKSKLAEAGAAHFGELQRLAPNLAPTRIVILLDNYPGFVAVFDKQDFGTWIERLERVVAEGRSLGIHWAITADRANAVNLTLASSSARRVVLRMANDDDYAALNLDGKTARAANLPPGRGFIDSTMEFHAAALGGTGEEQNRAVEAIALELRTWQGATTARRIGVLPTRVTLDELGTQPHMHVVIGIGQAELAPVAFDLRDGNVLIAGPNRSGRSTALRTLATSLTQSTPEAELVLLAPRRSPLTTLGIWTSTATTIEQCEASAAHLATLLGRRGPDAPPLVIVIDDATELDESSAASALERLARRGRDDAITLILAAESSLARRSYSGPIPEVRRDRRGVLLVPDVDLDGDLVGARLPRWTGPSAAGRGYLVDGSSIDLVQVATVDQ